MKLKALLTFSSIILSTVLTFAQKGADRGKINDVVDSSGGGIISVLFIVVVILGFVVLLIRSIFSSKK